MRESVVRSIVVAVVAAVVLLSSSVRADWITHAVISERAGIDSLERFLVLTDTVALHFYGEPTIPLGDISGDGIGDILIVRNSGNGIVPAYSYVVFGDHEPTGESQAELIGPRAGSNTVGDLNGDGFIDIGGFVGTVGAEAFRVYFGGPSLDDSADFVLNGILFPYPSPAVDLDDDGILELPVATDINGGPVNIYKASPVLDTIPDWVIADTSRGFGNSLGVGDFNGDGYQDLVISAYRNRDTCLIKFYWGGPDFDTVADHVMRSTKLRLGEILLPLDDFNGDGYDDLLICGSTNEPYGIYFGGPEFDDSLDVVINWRGGYYVPTSADVAGDVNNDGYPDLVVGYDFGEEVNLYLGGPDIDSVMIADVYMSNLLINGENGFLGSFGYYVAGIGDFNGDGADDFVALSRTYDPCCWVGQIHFFAGWNGTATDVTQEHEPGLPSEYHLSQNFPNPFNPSTTIEFELPERCDVSLAVFNVLGQKLVELVRGEMAAGHHTVVWDGRGDNGEVLPSGVYFYRISSDQFTESKKMLLLK